ncbi:MAG TPA: hypothetical protein VGE47_00230 [Burkholderiaceae bacterium]
MKTLAWLLLAALLGALLAPRDQDDSKGLVNARRELWLLPDAPRKPDLSSQALALVSSPIFEAEAQVAVANAPPEDTRWRVAGVFGRGNERSVLIAFVARGKQSQSLHVGQKLPSGHKITKIEDSGVCVELGKKSYRLGVEYRE